MRLCAVILAAGLSSRINGFKPLLPLDGRSLLGRVVDLFRGAGISELLAVAGLQGQDVLQEANRLNIQAVLNADFALGMFSSVQTGLKAVPRDVDGVFILPVDIPLVRPQTVRLLTEAYTDSKSQTLIPCFGDQPGHPPLLTPAAVNAALVWTGPNGLRGALANVPCKKVVTADQGILLDVDTDENFAMAQHLWQRRGIPSPAEAKALLQLHQAGDRGLAHGQGVARAALAMGQALNRAGYSLDLELLESSALLHDIAKGQPRHEAEGARILESHGFSDAARIVIDHRDIDPAAVKRLSERELVYLADKVVRGPQRVPILQRFQEKLDRFAHDPEAVAAITRRRDHALAMRQLVERAAGMTLESILDDTEPWT